MKRVALKALTYGNLDALKREALYFDSILIDVTATRKITSLTAGLLKAFEVAEGKTGEAVDEWFAPWRATVEFLIGQGILVEYDFLDILRKHTTLENDEEQKVLYFKLRNEAMRPVAAEWSDAVGPLLMDEFNALMAEDEMTERKVLYLETIGEDLKAELHHWETRADRRVKIGAMLNGLFGDHDVLVPILRRSSLVGDAPLVRQREIANVVLERFPMPSAETSWASIIDFRSDSDNERCRLALRRWISQLVTSTKATSEIEEELDYLLHQYERLMELHRIKYQRTTLETAIVSALEVLENVIKLNWSKAAKALFDIKRARVDFLLEGQVVEGREVAYIVKAAETFGR